MPPNDPNYRQGTEFTGVKQLSFQRTVSGWTLEYRSFNLKFLFLTLPVISQLCSAKQRHLEAQALGPGRPYVGPNSPPLLISALFTMWIQPRKPRPWWGLFPYPCSRLALWAGFDQNIKVKLTMCPSQAWAKRPWHISTLFVNSACSSQGYPIATYPKISRAKPRSTK